MNSDFVGSGMFCPLFRKCSLVFPTFVKDGGWDVLVILSFFPIPWEIPFSCLVQTTNPVRSGTSPGASFRNFCLSVCSLPGSTVVLSMELESFPNSQNRIPREAVAATGVSFKIPTGAAAPGQKILFRSSARKRGFYFN